MRIVLTGCNGLLGQTLIHMRQAEFPEADIIGWGMEPNAVMASEMKSYRSFDLTQFSDVTAALREDRPDRIIHTAALTDVDGCERNPEANDRVNYAVPAHLAASGIPMVQISTDYVFDGVSGPYRENDPIAPLSAYGMAKWKSEGAVLGANPNNLVLRTMLLWGDLPGMKKSFVEFIRESLAAKKNIRIVTDQIGNPTYAPDLAKAIWKLLKADQKGLFHVAGSDIMGRLEWSLAIAHHFGLDPAVMSPCLTSDLGQPARRPLNSGLICEKLFSAIGFRPRGVLEQLQELK